MYGIAITVAACLQAGTRADVGWLVSVEDLPRPDWSNAIVFTPGGGKTGSLLGGALDAKLGDKAGRWAAGRLVELEITQADALIAGLPSPGEARCLLFPADVLPDEVWELAPARERFCLVSEMDEDEVVSTSVFWGETISGADPEIQGLFTGPAGSVVSGERVVSVFVAVPQMVIVGAGPVAEAVAELAGFVGWQARLVDELSLVTGLIAPLSDLDKVVVAAHDIELAGSALAAALASDCGYIGSVGSRKMQSDRADWLALRGVADLTRAHGPAGLDIGAGAPAEVAVAIVAEAIAETGRRRP